MNKFVSFLIVLLAIAVATPVLAEQRLSLSGEMRVRGWHVDQDNTLTTDTVTIGGVKYNAGYALDANDNVITKEQDRTSTFADQRLRIAGKLSIAEGVSVSFRMDATESTWGSQPGFGSGRLVLPNNTMQWDRAHLDIEKGMFALRAGQLYAALGKSGFDAQDNGLMLTVKGQVPVTVFFMVDDNKGKNNKSDAYYFGLNVGHKTNSYAANVYAAGQKNSSRAFSFYAIDTVIDEEVYVLGVNYSANFDAIKLFAEVDYFFGDAYLTKAAGVNVVPAEKADAYGLQAFVDVSAGVAEGVTVGGQFFYAMGDDEDVQYSILGNDFGGWDPIYALGTGLDNEAIKSGRPFEMLGNGAGIYAGRVYASVKATDDVTVAGSLFYGTADEKDRALYKDVMAIGVGMSYAVMANTKLGVQVQYAEMSKENVDKDQDNLSAGMGLLVSF